MFHCLMNPNNVKTTDHRTHLPMHLSPRRKDVGNSRVTTPRTVEPARSVRTQKHLEVLVDWRNHVWHDNARGSCYLTLTPLPYLQWITEKIKGTKPHIKHRNSLEASLTNRHLLPSKKKEQLRSIPDKSPAPELKKVNRQSDVTSLFLQQNWKILSIIGDGNCFFVPFLYSFSELSNIIYEFEKK